MLAAIFLKTGRLPSEIRNLPIGERAFVFACMRAEQEANQKNKV